MNFKVAVVFIALLSGVASSQDAAPERLDTITAHHVVTLLSNGPTGINYCVAWFNNGFGRIDAPTSKAPIPVEIDKPYVWFRITNPSNGSMDDYWIAAQAVWDAYVVSSNVTTLKANSLHFGVYTISSSYIPPVINEPVTWEDRTDTLTVGYTSANTLIVVRKQGLTWEWSVRGANGSDVWNPAATKDLAKSAARLVIP